MCIIAIKPRGVDFPSVKTIKTMFEYNPDGFTIVYSEGGEPPKIHRTMSSDAALQIYNKITDKCSADDTNLFIHARIATHGTINISNCHGWRDVKTGMVFAHNGILDIKAKGDMTDSETFFRYIFMPIYRNGGWKFANEAISAFIGTSKFVFMDKSGEIYYAGKYITDNGVMYSNTTYIDYKSKYNNTSYKSAYDDYYDGLYDYEDDSLRGYY